MFEILPLTEEPNVAIRLTGDLAEEDVLDIRAYLTGLSARHPALCVLFATERWTGWEGWRALWEDAKADLHLNRRVARLAMVGSGTVDRLMTEAMSPFAHARVRWFPSSDLEQAWTWLVAGCESGERNGDGT